MKRIGVVLLGLLLWAQLAHASVVVRSSSSGQTNTCTGGSDISLTIDTSSASLVVAMTVSNDALTAPGGTDSWTLAKSNTVVVSSGMYYKLNPTQSASYSVTLSNANRCAALAVVALDNSSGTSSLHDTSANAVNCGGNTCQAAAAVGASGEAVISAITVDWHETDSIDSSFTILQSRQFVSGTAYGVSIAWKETSGTENPTWTFLGDAGSTETTLAAFVVGNNGGGAAATPCIIGGGLVASKCPGGDDTGGAR